MSDVNWAVIGLGGAGRGHAQQISRTDGLRLAGVYDVDQSIAKEAAGVRGVTAYPTFEALLTDPNIQGVTLATPSALHAEEAIRALESGKHVGIEKPFALNGHEAQAIADAARKANRLALPLHNRRWDPDFRLVLDVARAGTLGEVRVVRSAVGGPSPDSGWRLKRDMGGGRLNDWGPHLLSQIYEWFGGQALSVSGYTTTIYPQNECEDLFAADFRFPSDVLVSVMMSGFSALTPPRWEIIGSEGTLQLTGELHGEFALAWKRLDGQQFAQTYRRQDIALPVPIYAAIVDYLADHGQLPVTLEEGVAVSRWLGSDSDLCRGWRRTGETPMTIGLHVTFAENDLPALFQMASELGYDFVELNAPRGPASGPDPVAWPTEAEAREAVREVRRQSEQSGVRTDSFYGGGFWVLRDEDQPARAKGDIDFFSLLIPMLTHECGSKVIVLNLAGALVAPGAAYGELDRNGSAIATDAHFARAAEALHTLGEVAGRAGSVIGVEMHGSSLADTGASTRRVIEMANHPAVGVTWDTGNLFTMGRAESWENQLSLVSPFIVHVHLKNGLYGRNKWRRASLEGGAMEDVGTQVLALRGIGYDGALVVEAPGLRHGQREMAETDLHFLQKILWEQQKE